MKVRTKVETLAGNSLNWAVGCAMEGGEFELASRARQGDYSPSSDWSLGGPIIESAQIRISPTPNGLWCASREDEDLESFGPTPLIAAMRLFIRHRHASEVDIPWQLLDRAQSIGVNPAQATGRAH